MKKLILLSVVIVFFLSAVSASEKYYAKMGETLAQYANCQTANDFKVLANKFKTISNVEADEWLPLYYESHCYVIMTFMSNEDAVEKDKYLLQAEANIEKMIEMVPDETEVYALQALLYMAKMVVDPAVRAQKLTPLIYQSVAKSLELDPDNPRAKYVKLSNEHGIAQFFGNDLSPYCEQANKIIADWDNYTTKSPIHPVWGKEMLLHIAKTCSN